MIGRRRAKADPVTPEVRAEVLRRDGRCFASRIYSDHECRDGWGNPHRSDDLLLLSIEHVKRDARMGKRAPSDPAHLVALCTSANVVVPSRSVRVEMRGYLAALYPSEWA